MKPGIRSTEFYATLATNVVGLLVLFGYVAPEAGDPLIAAIGQVVGGLMVVLGNVGYAISRGKAKSGA